MRCVQRGLVLVVWESAVHVLWLVCVYLYVSALLSWLGYNSVLSYCMHTSAVVVVMVGWRERGGGACVRYICIPIDTAYVYM